MAGELAKVGGRRPLVKMWLMNPRKADHGHEQWRSKSHSARILFLVEDRIHHEDSDVRIAGLGGLRSRLTWTPFTSGTRLLKG